MEKLVESYWLRDIGDYQYYLVVNLLNKSTGIQYSHDGVFQVWEDSVSEDFKPDGLPDMGYYSVFMNRCKDQIYFLLIPTHKITKPGQHQDRKQEEFFKHLLPKKIKEGEESLEYEVLQKIKFALFCKNEAIVIRLLEQYMFDKTEEMYSEDDIKKAIDYGAELGLNDDIGNSFEWSEKQNKWIKQFKK